MIKLAEKIGLDKELTEKLAVLSEKRGDDITALADTCLNKSFSCLNRQNNLMRLAVILECAKRVKEKYDTFKISETVYFDTMSDIKIWCKNNGIENYGWLQNHVKFELFRLGRLQFQLYECKNKTLSYKKLPFDYGEKLIYIHIPEGEKLDFDKCKDSLEKANEFFALYFPQYEYKFYFCESWLLYENNRDFMDENSNIIKFMSLFDIAYSVKDDSQAIERIFKKRKILKSTFEEKTSLQKKAKEYMLNGNKLGMGIGVISKN